MNFIKQNKWHSAFLLGALVAITSVVFLTGYSVGAQGKKPLAMRCTPVSLNGVLKYDTLTKKINRVSRKVIINRCVSDEAICYHSFDQSGSLTCVNK